jgi:hypothetical protein
MSRVLLIASLLFVVTPTSAGSMPDPLVNTVKEFCKAKPKNKYCQIMAKVLQSNDPDKELHKYINAILQPQGSTTQLSPEAARIILEQTAKN